MTPLNLADREGYVEVVEILSAHTRNLASNGTETKHITNKAMKIGVTFSVIAALIVAIGCVAANVTSSILVIAGVSVVAALIAGSIAGDITYAVSKPDSVLDKTNSHQHLSWKFAMEGEKI